MPFFSWIILCIAAIAGLSVCGCTLDDGLDGEDVAPASVVRTGSPSLQHETGWIGLYKTQSSGCTSPQTLESCATEFYDCLRVQRSADHYSVELYSVQANQHICAFNLEMASKGNALVYADQDGRKVTLRAEGAKLVLITNRFPPSPGFCGAHGSFDSLAFPLASKQPQDEVCFQDEGP